MTISIFFSIRPKISHEMLVVFITIQIITFWASSTLAFIRNCIQCVEQKRSSINEATYTSFVKVTHIMIQIAIAATNDHHGDFWLQKFKVISGCFCKSHIWWPFGASILKGRRTQRYRLADSNRKEDSLNMLSDLVLILLMMQMKTLNERRNCPFGSLAGGWLHLIPYCKRSWLCK